MMGFSYAQYLESPIFTRYKYMVNTPIKIGIDLTFPLAVNTFFFENGKPSWDGLVRIFWSRTRDKTEKQEGNRLRHVTCIDFIFNVLKIKGLW